MTVTLPCQSQKTVMTQNGRQKWKEHVGSSKIAYFEVYGIIEEVLRGHVWYVNILTWPQGFQVKLLYLVLFLLYLSLLWELREQKKLENFAILTRKPRSHAWILIYRTWPIGAWTFKKLKIPTAIKTQAQKC